MSFDEQEGIKKMLESVSGPLTGMVSKSAAIQIAQKIYLDAIKDINLLETSADQLMIVAKSSLRAAKVFTTAAHEEMDFSSNMMEMFQAIMKADDNNPFDL